MTALATRLPTTALRVFPVASDNMEPTFARGDFAFVVPVERYEGEGAYVVLDACGGLTLYRFESAGRGLIGMWSDNPLYSRREIAADTFTEMVVAKVVMCAAVLDRRLMDRVAGGRA